jgi:hypothetical protein
MAWDPSGSGCRVDTRGASIGSACFCAPCVCEEDSALLPFVTAFPFPPRLLVASDPARTCIGLSASVILAPSFPVTSFPELARNSGNEKVASSLALALARNLRSGRLLAQRFNRRHRSHIGRFNSDPISCFELTLLGSAHREARPARHVLIRRLIS